jgi:hypothetical protein
MQTVRADEQLLSGVASAVLEQGPDAELTEPETAESDIRRPVAAYLQDIGASAFFDSPASAQPEPDSLSALATWQLRVEGVRAVGLRRTYDLSVASTHLFVCNGVVVHNCRSLRFDDKPDYAYLRRIMRELFYRKGYQSDFVFDWTIMNYQSDFYRQSQQTPGAGGAGGGTMPAITSGGGGGSLQIMQSSTQQQQSSQLTGASTAGGSAVAGKDNAEQVEKAVQERNREKERQEEKGMASRTQKRQRRHLQQLHTAC